MLDFARFTHLTFDCYGTLVDWETGILAALSPLLERHGASAEPREILRLYAEHEARLESGPQYRSYREILRGTVAGIAADLGFEPAQDELAVLGDSIGAWPPFPDTPGALRRLGARYRLAVLSNVDDDLFERTAATLGMRFDAVITAQQVGSYKPSMENFRFALRRLGVDAARVLHVAHSLYHDHAPAKRLGLSTVWVNRPSRRRGVGVAPPAEVAPDLEVPDLASLAEAAGL